MSFYFEKSAYNVLHITHTKNYTTAYNQMEFLIKRNMAYEITEITTTVDGKNVIKCKLVENVNSDSSVFTATGELPNRNQQNNITAELSDSVEVVEIENDSYSSEVTGELPPVTNNENVSNITTELEHQPVEENVMNVTAELDDLNLPNSTESSSFESSINSKIEKYNELNDKIIEYERNDQLSESDLNSLRNEYYNLKTEIIINQLALNKYNVAKSVEPNITDKLQSFEDETAKLVGLEHRFKTPESLSRKIESDAIADNITYEQAANNVGDSLRYTLQVEDANYTNKVVNTLKELENNGYKINKFKNFWGNEKYQGINVSIISPEGLKMELQFHTESSFYTKEVLNHKYYEIERSITATELEKSEAIKIMKDNQSKVPIPYGIIGLEWK